MMDRSHLVSGAAAGLGLGAATDASPVVCGVLVGVTAVGALIPDIDCPTSTVTRMVSVLGRLVSWVARQASAGVYAATKGGFGVATHAHTLRDPYRWRDPRLVFINSMSDLLYFMPGFPMSSSVKCFP
jgi:hypothetical protein